MEEELRKTAQILNEGGVILYPTDTIWGIGCLCDDERAIDRIYSIKHRPAHKQMICLVDGCEMIGSYVDLPVVEIQNRVTQFKDRPTSIVFEGVKNLPKILVSDTDTIAFRITADLFSKKMVQLMKKPLVATSANISGDPSPKGFDRVSNKILEDVDYAVNLYRDRKCSVSSRVVKFTKEGRLIVLRE